MHKYFDLKENHMNFLIFLFSKSNLDIFIDKYISSFFFSIKSKEEIFTKESKSLFIYILL